jgi:hypothetical protein
MRQIVSPAHRLVTSRYGRRSSRCRTIAPVFIDYRGYKIRIHPEPNGELDHDAIIDAKCEVDEVLSSGVYIHV